MRIRKLKNNWKEINMTWKKGPSPGNPAGAVYYSTSCIVWRQDKAPLCKYIVQRVLRGKAVHWQLWQWNDANGTYIPIHELLACLRHAQEKADWLERKDLRAGVKPDHSSPIEAAAAAFAVCLTTEE